VNVTGLAGVIVAGKVKSVANGNGLMVIEAVLDALTALASVAVTLTVNVPLAP
jgi:hypothetical protein